MDSSSNNYKINPAKSNVFEVLVSVTLLMVFLLVVATGILSFLKLNHIASTVKSGIRPDRKLILVKEIYNDLSEAENSVKSFSLTRSDDYMIRFYQLTEATGEKVDELLGLVPADDNFSPYFDTLDLLVEEKFNILNKLLVILDEFRVQQAMQQVMQSIQEQKETAGPGKPDTSSVNIPQKKESFFNRLFKSKGKKNQIPSDSAIVLEEPVNQARSADISEQVEAVQLDALLRERLLRQEEWKLLQQDKLVMKRIRTLLALMEDYEANILLVHTNEAEKEAVEVKNIITAFGMAASLLLIIAAFVIFRYVKKNNEYKAVLNRSRKDAEELARAKEIFLANMSHEIRTPMNIISGFLHQVLNGKLEPEQKERLEIVKKSSDHLLHLLNDLLDLSKLQVNKLELIDVSFCPAEVIREVYCALEPIADAKKLKLLTTVDPELQAIVFGDPVRLRQVLFNLVGNAIKYTEEGHISIRAFPTEQHPETVLIAFEVSDTGIGINKADLEKIFWEFEQLHNISGKNDAGAGLGLSITRKLVQLLGGVINVESKPSEGTVFRADIPFRREIENAAPSFSPEKVAISIHSLRLLVVDDEEYNRRLVKLILEKYGCIVLESGSGEGAIKLFEDQEIDMVLMDIRMPGMQGPEAAGEIKRIAKKKGKYIPVIAVSAAIDKGDIEKYRQEGIDNFVLKPFKEDDLVRVITHHMKIPALQYDLMPLKESSSGNDTFFIEMINMFIQNTEAGLIQLGQFLTEEKWEAAADLAHKISSPCSHLKAEKLHSLLKQLEYILRNSGHQQSAGDLLSQAKREFNLIREDIKRKHI